MQETVFLSSQLPIMRMRTHPCNAETVLMTLARIGVNESKFPAKYSKFLRWRVGLVERDALLSLCPCQAAQRLNHGFRERMRILRSYILWTNLLVFT